MFSTLFKMGMVMDFDTCGYGDSIGGLGLKGITPKKVISRFPREIFEILPFFGFSMK